MRSPSSTGPEGSLVVHTTRASALMARRSSSLSMPPDTEAARDPAVVGVDPSTEHHQTARIRDVAAEQVRDERLDNGIGEAHRLDGAQGLVVTSPPSPPRRDLR
jgi:hypothetical protein